MSNKKAYQEKIEAELDLAMAKLNELRAQARSSAADVHIKYDKQIETLEKEVVAVKSKVKAMAEAGENSWEQLKNGVEHGWNALHSAVQDAVDNFKK